MTNRTISDVVSAVILTLAIAAAPAAAAIIYVDDDATGTNDGSSWENAYPNLRDALAAAESGDAIRIAQGVYRPDQGAAVNPGNRAATFMVADGIQLLGGYAGAGAPDPNARDITAFETILSGDLDQDDGPDFANNDENSYHVVRIVGPVTSVLLDGLTISGGNATEQVDPDDRGAGLDLNAANPTLLRCTFEKNMARVGAGLYASDSSPTLILCVFRNNQAIIRGAAVRNFGDSSPVLEACRFFNNSADDGGAVHNNIGTTPLFRNCVFSGNAAADEGGAMYNLQAHPILLHCTISANTANDGGGVYNMGDASPVIQNSILWGNSANGDDTSEVAQVTGGMTTIEYCTVQGWTGSLGGTGNIGDDPMFVDPDGADDEIGTVDDDFHLSDGSPAINAGSRYLTGAIVGDAEGNPRVQNCQADMGAFESPAPPPAFDDCNSNGIDDDCDTFTGASPDCNRNLIPDECEVADGTEQDCNGNGILDSCEIASVHNCCETNHGPGCNNPEIEACVCATDPYCCNTDWDRTCVDEVLLFECGTCEMVQDCNENGVPDECEPDCNENGIADECDIDSGLSRDCQGNGIPDECEPDFDSDGTIDDCDSDIDGDGIDNPDDVCDFTPPGAPIQPDGGLKGDLDGDCDCDLDDYAQFQNDFTGTFTP